MVFSHTKQNKTLPNSILLKRPVLDWSAPSVSFPLLIPLLDSDAYRDTILSGAVSSVGGISESLVKKLKMKEKKH